MDKRECLQQLLTKGRQRLSECHLRARKLDGLKGVLFMRRDKACQAMEKHLTQLQVRLTNILDERLAQIEQLCAEKEIHISSEKRCVLEQMSTLTQICSRSTDFLQFGNEELCKTKDCEEVILSFEKILKERRCPYIEEKHINLSYVPLLLNESVTMSSVGMLMTSHLDPHSVEIERCRDKPREVSLCASLGLSLFIKTNASSLSTDDLELFQVKVTDSKNIIKPITVAVCSDQPSKLQVTFSPTFPEAYLLSVVLYDTHVMNSPYKFNVRSSPNKVKCAPNKSESSDSGNLSISPSQMSSDGVSSGNYWESCKAGNLLCNQRLESLEHQNVAASQKSGPTHKGSNVYVSTEKHHSYKSNNLHQCHGRETNRPNSSLVNNLESRDNIQRSSAKSQIGNCTEKEHSYRNNDPHQCSGRATCGPNSPPLNGLESRGNNERSSLRSQSGNCTERQQGYKSTDPHQFSERAMSGSNSSPLNNFEYKENPQTLFPRSQSGNSCSQGNNSGVTRLSQSRSAQANGLFHSSNRAQRLCRRSSPTASEANKESNNKIIGQADLAQRNIVSKALANQVHLSSRTNSSSQWQHNRAGNSLPSKPEHSQQTDNRRETSKPSRGYGESPSRAHQMSPRSGSVMSVGRNGSATCQTGQTALRFTNGSPDAYQNKAGICKVESKCEEAQSYSSSMTSYGSEKYSPNRDNQSEHLSYQHKSFPNNRATVPTADCLSVKSGIRRELFTQRASQPNSDFISGRMCPTNDEECADDKTRQIGYGLSPNNVEMSGGRAPLDKDEISGRNTPGKVQQNSGRKFSGSYKYESPSRRHFAFSSEQPSMPVKHSQVRFYKTDERDSQGNSGNFIDDSGQNFTGNIERASCRNVRGYFEDDNGQNSAVNIEQATCRIVQGYFEDDSGQNSAGNIEHSSCRNNQEYFEDDSGQNIAGNIEQASCRNVQGCFEDDSGQNSAGNIEQVRSRNFQGNLDDTSARNCPNSVEHMEGRNSSCNFEHSSYGNFSHDRVKLTAKRSLTPKARTTQSGIYMSASGSDFKTSSCQHNPRISGLNLKQWEAQRALSKYPIQARPNSVLTHNFH